ncbi:hypothetical protein GCWU000341_00502 [Oribacterium sp. oral taxon 078 str. F0262]|nr:hypothetical protein GCWU000341_00502 [Oribacterium sp. oral taxon 078 str. F0262]
MSGSSDREHYNLAFSLRSRSGTDSVRRYPLFRRFFNAYSGSFSC